MVVLIKNLRAFAADNHPIPFIKIGDLLRQRRERERV